MPMELSSKVKRLGVLTGGGDVPGLNAAIKAIVYRAYGLDIAVAGLRAGWEGIAYLDRSRSIEEQTFRAEDDRTWLGLETIQVRVAPGAAVQITLAGDRPPPRESLRRFVEGTRRRLPELSGVLMAGSRGGLQARRRGRDGRSRSRGRLRCAGKVRARASLCA